MELQSILTAIRHLPPRQGDRPASGTGARAREGGHQAPPRRGSARRLRPCPRRWSRRTCATFNGQPGDPRSFDRLDALLERPGLPPGFWRVAAEEINYRRFFDINDLAAIRVEDPRCSRHARLILGCSREGKVDRPAHRPPRRPAAIPAALPRAARRSWPRGAGRRPRARLRRGREDPGRRRAAAGDDGRSHGTTGYDFLNMRQRLFVDAPATGRSTASTARFTGARRPTTPTLVYEKKR